MLPPPGIRPDLPDCAPRQFACEAPAPAQPFLARNWTGENDADPVGEIGGFAQVVRDQQHRGSTLDPQALHDRPQLFTRELIECAKRFIKQEQLRIMNERTTQGRALQHTP